MMTRNAMRRGIVWTVGVAAVLLLALPAWAAPFRNTVNRAFASRCNGPQGAIVVARQKVTAAASATTVHKALLAQHSARQLRTAMVTYQRIQRLRLKKRPGQVRFPRLVAETLNGKLVQPNLVHARQVGATIGDPANNLTFQFEGFSASDETALRSYLDGAYPKAKLIYGPPAFNMTVKIIQDDTISAVQGGTYDPATNEIRIPTLTGNFPEDTYVLLLLVLNAFHDDAVLYYDSWEQGMAGAAAYAIQMTPGVSPGYDIVDPGPFYCLSVYEAENQPELGNSTYYPASGGTNMLVWRVAMARAAWQKCWIEDPTFFAKFNAAYYAAYNASSGDTLPGDVPSLKETVASVLPTVEDTPFASWYEHQYALDTSVRVGQKLYTWNIPLQQSVALIAELYETLAGGDEQPSGGQATTVYWDYTKQTQLFAEEGNNIEIPAGGSSPGEGFLLPTFFNIGGAQRITVQMDVAGLRRNYVYPYGERGFELSENNLYGGIVGSDAGTVNVTGGNGITDLAADRGVWGKRITTASLTPLKLQVTYQPTGGQPFTRNVNVGWDSYVCFMEAGAQATLTHNFTYDTNGLYLMSLPLQPQTADMASILGIPASQLLLAWWDPNFAGDNKYRLWPSFPMQTLGSAYWLRVLSDTVVNMTGLKADPALPYEVTIGGGWDLLGCPRTEAVALADVQVRQGSAEPVTWAEAVTQHLVQDGLYSYSQSNGYELKDALQPWQGYWLRCLVPNGVTLIFPAQTAASAALAVQR